MALKLDSRGGMSASRSPHTTYSATAKQLDVGRFRSGGEQV